MATRFSNDEMNLMSIYNPGSRQGLIAELNHMLPFLASDEAELRALTEGTIQKLNGMKDVDFDEITILLDFCFEIM